jgi:hypothetical protein
MTAGQEDTRHGLQEHHHHHHQERHNKEEWQRTPPQRSRGIVPLCRVFVSSIDSPQCSSDKTKSNGVKEYKNDTKTRDNEQQRFIPPRRCQNIPFCQVYLKDSAMDRSRFQRRGSEMKIDSPPRYPKRKTYPTVEYFASAIVGPSLDRYEKVFPQHQEQRQRNHTTRPRRNTTDCLIGLEISFRSISAHEK